MTTPAVLRGACLLLFLLSAVPGTGRVQAQDFRNAAPVLGRRLLNDGKTPTISIPQLTKIKTIQEVLSLPLTPDSLPPIEAAFFQYRYNKNLDRAYVLSVLAREVAQETTGSARWAALQSLRGFGGFYTPGFNFDANEAYLALFTAPITPETRPFLEQAVVDYLASIVTVPLPELINRNFRTFMRRPPFSWQVYDGTSTPKVLRAALDTALNLPPRLDVQDYEWAEAANSVDTQDAIRQEIEARLATTTDSKPRLRLLRMLIPLYEDQNPARALDLMTEAEALYTSLKFIDIDFPERHTRLLISQNKLSEAIQIQSNWSKWTRIGYARLLNLMFQAGDTEGVQRTVAELHQPGANPRAIYEAITALNRPRSLPGIVPKEIVRQLSLAYLNLKTGREIDKEVDVRLILARLLYENHEKDAAVQILDALVLPAPRSRYPYGDQLTLLRYTRERMAAGTFCDA